MAPWQVRFAVMPRMSLPAHGPLPAGPFANRPWWRGQKLPRGLEMRLAAVGGTLPPEARASEGDASPMQRWGTLDGNRIDIRFASGVVESVVAYVDVRRLDPSFGALLLHFVRTAGAVLVRDDGLIVEPTIAAYAAALRTSQAWALNASSAPTPPVELSDEDGG
jgi:hypothetical protein